jgi:hypothetical protein
VECVEGGVEMVGGMSLVASGSSEGTTGKVSWTVEGKGSEEYRQVWRKLHVEHDRGCFHQK